MNQWAQVAMFSAAAFGVSLAVSGGCGPVSGPAEGRATGHEPASAGAPSPLTETLAAEPPPYIAVVPLAGDEPAPPESAPAAFRAAGPELEIFFDTGSDRVGPEYSWAVGKVAEVLRKYPELTAVIEGHTDSRGPAAVNLTLSQQRAEAVAKLFEEDHGIDPSRLTVAGCGTQRPAATNDTTEGRARNRRVSVVLAGE